MITLDRPVLICIVGPSGSGKTTLANHLQETLGIPTLVSYTTRPKRAGETNGVEHWFVTEKEMSNSNAMLAYTKFAGHHYWVPISDLPIAGPCTYVIDEKGLEYLMGNFADEYFIFSVLVKRGIESLVKQVGIDRVMRDLERKSVPEEDYDLVLENFGTLEEFIEKSTDTIRKIFE